MNIFIKLLPIILISIIFYLLFYNLYPKYQETLSLAKKLNELQNRKKELENIENLIKSLSENVNLKQVLDRKDILDLWLPRETKFEEIFYFLESLYRSFNLTLGGYNLNINKEPKFLNKNVLPVKTINFSLSGNLDENDFYKFVETIEKNTRLMAIKNAVLRADKNFEISVETYYQKNEGE